jgi:hypothetical protein
MNKNIKLPQADLDLISAYLDNELDDNKRAEVEQRITHDQKFAECLVARKNQDDKLLFAYSEIDNKPVPDALLALLNIEDHKLEEKKQAAPIQTSANDSFFSRHPWMSLAASFAVVALSTPLYFSAQKTNTLNLAQALNDISSGNTVTLNDESSLYLSMSFENNQAQFCREYFKTQETQSTQVIACRGEQGWQQIITAEVVMISNHNYQPASGNSSVAVEHWLDVNMSSDPLTVKQELTKLNSQ